VCLRLSAKESFQDAQVDIAALIGVSVGHSSQQRQIGRRSQISGVRWNSASVNPMLGLRCAYLNGQLDV
jgi:hypothetical protein